MLLRLEHGDYEYADRAWWTDTGGLFAMLPWGVMGWMVRQFG